MRARRRRTFVVVADPSTSALDVDTEHAVFHALLNALRGHTSQVVVDLLGADRPLPAAARTAASRLQALTRTTVLDVMTGTYDRNPFQAVTIHPDDEVRWPLLVEVAPYSRDLHLEANFVSDVLTSTGGLSSIRMRLRSDQAETVRTHLKAVPGLPSGVDIEQRPPRGRTRRLRSASRE